MTFARLPYSAARWIFCDDEVALDEYVRAQSHLICNDQHDQKAILLDDLWRLNFLKDRFPKIEYQSTSEKV